LGGIMTEQLTRRTKIVATLGPAWESVEQMRILLDAGVNVIRVNASHGLPETRIAWINRLNAVIAERAPQRGAAILVDLQGPRIRVGKLSEPRLLTEGDTVTFAPEEEARGDEIPTTYAALARDVRAGARVLLDDGLLAVDVEVVDGSRVIGRVRYGGLLKSNKGINLPGIDVSAPALSDRDRDEITRVIGLGIDYIAISFVQRPEDVTQVRALVPPGIKLIAKIEKDTALARAREILAVSDGLMVARGDLGVELPFEEVPLAQKRLIHEANLAGKPVITATQMLESMIHAPRPTRAEVSDVANAILDGTDALMLSAETAVGKYPLEAVQAMTRIAHEIEPLARRPANRDEAFLRPSDRSGPAPTEEAIAVAVCAAAEMLHASAICCLTASGFTARTVAAQRPGIPILALTPDVETFRQLSLVWGVIPAMAEHVPKYDMMLPIARKVLLELGLAAPGDRVVVTAGVPFDKTGTTNLLRVEVV
jgi:pyruvate kinase